MKDGQNIHCYWSVRCEFALVQKGHVIVKSHMNVTWGTRVGLREQFSCLICRFLGICLVNFSLNTKISLLLPQSIVFPKFGHFSCERKETGSLGTTESEVWIRNFNVKAWKTTEHNLHKIWRSVKFCKKSAKRAHPFPTKHCETVVFRSCCFSCCLSPDQVLPPLSLYNRFGFHDWSLWRDWVFMADELVGWSQWSTCHNQSDVSLHHTEGHQISCLLSTHSGVKTILTICKL